ncbi:thermonuclease family protein [Methylobacterium sp. WL2]|uniref:thermonuclease family protein n=1 Tax=Methylobacterium sp. WL2 TaxID=2603902 RepID=UPI0011C7B016|nr:thermonuclease family protein [Methylobacterium sp. WL2]TXN54050.1 thermonuclease family protein [Methylobacterium sp. WL2]
MSRATSRTAIALAVVVVAGIADAAEPIVGRASIVDGDTIEIRGTRFRLQGVDTPESAQLCRDRSSKEYRCGQIAANALADRIGAGNVACEPITTDRYGRTVAVCRLGNEDLNGWLVAQGLGLAYRRYSTAYVFQEDAAKAARRGLWAGSFTAPWEWRKGQRTMFLGFAANGGPDGPIPGPIKPTPLMPGKNHCKIKGNINRKGDHIYHVLGSRDYDRTVITETAGEKWFCSEAEALAAGWRAPRH